ncbi:MAG: CvpA family protein [Clostridia bacterium]|nr:CvpA family protein [Clostridia bacterium]
MNLVDILLILICILSIVFASKKGFFHTLFDLCGKFIAMAAAKLLSDAYCEKVYEALFKQGISNTLHSKLEGISSVDVGQSVQEALEGMPSTLNSVMSILGVDKQALADKADSLGLTGENLIQAILDEIVSPIAIAVCRALLFVGIFVILAFILRFVLKIITKLLKKLPKLKKVDKVFGGVLGAVRGMIVIVILIYIITFVAGLIDSDIIVDAVANSKIVSVGQNALQLISGGVK